ncbi:MAG TPA: hypothetical protein P5307_15445, partial [Pirellulaceae bacterium]|nr:hypothetical protein [Pirellulaceae bacterium]
SASPIDGALARSYFPAIVGVARSFENAEYQRRLTLTALAIKKFQVAHQTWPGRLDELTAVGLSADEWSIPGLGQFGYEIDDDSARVFMYDITQPATAPALPATIRYDERFAYLMVTVH